MNIVFDSSYMVALLVKDHPFYDRAVNGFLEYKKNEFIGYVSTHTLTEIYSGFEMLFDNLFNTNQMKQIRMLHFHHYINITISMWVSGSKTTK